MPSLVERIDKQSIREFEQYLDGTIRRNELDLSRYKSWFLLFVLSYARIRKRIRDDIKHELNTRKRHYSRQKFSKTRN